MEPIIASLNKQQLNTTVFDALHDAVCNDAARYIVIGDLINFSILIQRDECCSKICDFRNVAEKRWCGEVVFNFIHQRLHFRK